MRHPMYTGIVLVVFGLWLREPRVAVAIAAVALVTLLLGKARFEEQLLRERYPDYDAYRARTWGVLPGI
jgi:protein-S-isoprenylcysteine O-methyltransferase Ste14